MKQKKEFFIKNYKSIIIGLFLIVISFGDYAQATNGRTAIRSSRSSAGVRETTAAVITPIAETNSVTITEIETQPEPEIIENKSSEFGNAFNKTSTLSDMDSSTKSLATMIASQRAMLDVKSVDTTSVRDFITLNGRNKCDLNLRTCMQEKCGKTFSKCANDGDTDWGIKIDKCKRNSTTCSAKEFQIFATEIKADRDNNALLESYSEVINCGNKYNNCLITQCGRQFENCIGKPANDRAIEKCSKIAKECIGVDNGLESRTRQVFGTLNVNAEKQIVNDEKRLYALRDEMESVCNGMGAMFDQRSLDCVYTVNFWGADSNKPFASKKAYAGNTFDCTQDWFGIDVTTFKENAYRLTRSQTSASSGLMGAGIGIGASSLTSVVSSKIGGSKGDAAKTAIDSKNKTNKNDEKINESDSAAIQSVGAQNTNEPRAQ